MRATAAGVLLLAMLATACSDAPEDEPADTAWTSAECPSDVTGVVVTEVACGYLRVPEDRSRPDRTIEVFVTRVAPPEDAGGAPILVAGTDVAALPNYGGIAPLAQRTGREVIFLDPRGVGHSRPALDCPEVDAIAAEVLGMATDDAATMTAFGAAVTACGDRLTAEGIDLGAYNVTEMAADAEALRTALGVEEWNVVTYGTSSRIAWEMLRTAPVGIRSILFDSPEIPGTDPRLVAAEATPAVLARVLADCHADVACARAYPDVLTSMDDALARLGRAPVTLTLPDPRADGGTRTVLVDDALLVRLLRAMLSDGGSTGSLLLPASVPAVLALVDQGRLDELGPSLTQVLGDSPPFCLGYQPKCLPQHQVSVGVAYSVLCQDIAPGQQEAAVVRAAGDRAGFSSAYGASHYLEVCDHWPVGDPDPVGGETQAASDVPVLVTIGDYSTYAPEDVVRAGVSGLSDVIVAVVPHLGHNVVASSDCILQARNTWLEELALPPGALDCLADVDIEWVTDPESLLMDVSIKEGASPTATPEVEPGSLEGAWEVFLTRRQMRTALEAGGFPGIAADYFAGQEIPPEGVGIRTTVKDGGFSQAYNDGSGVWQVGWTGGAAIEGGLLTITDELSGSTDTLRWKVRGDRLEFEVVGSTAGLVQGFPNEAYLHAYFAAAPYRRVE